MLKDVLLDKSRRDRVVTDCVKLVDDEVAAKSGLSGLAVKGAFVIVSKVKPGFIREVVDTLLDDFVARLEPYYADWEKDRRGSFEGFLESRATDVANALLGVTDDKAKRAKNPTVKKAYDKLRPTAQKNVESAVPGVGRVIDRHAAAGKAQAG